MQTLALALSILIILASLGFIVREFIFKKTGRGLGNVASLLLGISMLISMCGPMAITDKMIGDFESETSFRAVREKRREIVNQREILKQEEIYQKLQDLDLEMLTLYQARVYDLHKSMSAQSSIFNGISLALIVAALILLLIGYPAAFGDTWKSNPDKTQDYLVSQTPAKN